MPKEHILVVDDEESILELLEYNLVRNGYQVSCVTSAEEALKNVRATPPQLILLDLMLPGMDGFQLCKILKHDPRLARIPVIMLTAKGDESDVIVGLELGADDYVVKPFSPKVVVARVKAVLRKQGQEPSGAATSVIRINDLIIDPDRHEVAISNQPVDLTFSEFRLLHLLAGRPGYVFSRNQIIDAVRGMDYAVTERSVDVQVVGLRKKLGEYGNYIQSVRGIGYRFKE